MAESVNKNDFVEIEFTARVKDGAVFDTNIPEEAKKINLDMKTKPLVVAIGKEMVLKGLDYALMGKEIGKEYEAELNPEDAFGKRDRNLIKTIPIKVFHEKEINPVPGMMLNMDNFVAKIVAVSGGRVITDFNNPLAGKIVVYKFKIKKKVTNDEEKVNSLLDYFIGKRFKFKISKSEDFDDSKTESFGSARNPQESEILDGSQSSKTLKSEEFRDAQKSNRNKKISDIEGKKIIFEKDAEVVNLLKEKFNEILGCEIELEKTEEKKETKAEKKAEEGKGKKEK